MDRSEPTTRPSFQPSGLSVCLQEARSPPPRPASAARLPAVSSTHTHHRVRRESAVHHLPAQPQRQVRHDVGLHEVLKPRRRAGLDRRRRGLELLQASRGVCFVYRQVHRHKRLPARGGGGYKISRCGFRGYSAVLDRRLWQASLSEKTAVERVRGGAVAAHIFVAATELYLRTITGRNKRAASCDVM